MQTFVTVTEEFLCGLITNAKHRVFFVGTGISKKVANCLGQFAIQANECRVELVLDSSADIYRLGYGEFKAIEILKARPNVVIRKESGIRINVLIVDKQAFIYSPTPLVLEEPAYANKPNGIVVSRQQAEELIKAIAPAGMVDVTQAKRLQIASPDNTPEIGAEIFKDTDINAIKQDLEAKPPQQFDLARIVNVYQSKIQFVELELVGCHLKSHTIQIPKGLLHLTRSSQVKERLKASYQLISENSKLLDNTSLITNKVASLREKFVHNIPGFGAVFLKDKRQEFEKEIVAIQSELEVVKDNLKVSLKKEFNQCKKDIVKVLLPIAKRNPPDELQYLIVGKPTPELLSEYIESELDKVIPSADEFVNKMKLKCVYKDVTYEMLKNNDFHEALLKQNKLNFCFRNQRVVVENRAIQAKQKDNQPDLF